MLVFINAGVFWGFPLTFEALIEAGPTLLQITLRGGGLAQRRKVMSCSGSSGGAKSIGNLRHRLLEVAPHQGLDIVVIVIVEHKSESVNK